LELKTNTNHYIKIYGVDILLEVQKVLKLLQFGGRHIDSEIKVLELNPNVEGYQFIAKIKHGDEVYLLDVEHKFDALANGKVRNGY